MNQLVSGLTKAIFISIINILFINNCIAQVHISPFKKQFDELITRKDYKTLAEQCTSMIRLKPASIELYCYRAYANARISPTELALQDANKAIVLSAGKYELYNINNKQYDVYLIRADVYEKMGKYPPALKDIGQSLNKSKTNSFAYVLRGMTHEHQDSTLAINDYTMAIRLNKNDITASALIAKIYFAKSKFNDAIMACSAAINSTPVTAGDEEDQMQCRAIRGGCYEILGDYLNAIEDLKIKVKDDTTWTAGKYFLADCYYYAHQYENAMNYFNQCCEADYSDACAVAQFIRNLNKGDCNDLSLEELLAINKVSSTLKLKYLVLNKKFALASESGSVLTFAKCVDNIHSFRQSKNVKILDWDSKTNMLLYKTGNAEVFKQYFSDIANANECGKVPFSNTVEKEGLDMVSALKADGTNVNILFVESYRCDLNSYDFLILETTQKGSDVKKKDYFFSIRPNQ